MTVLIASTVQRGTAYAEQLDEHEFTATVREAMRFSAYLRQPAHVSKEEKDKYVEEVIQLLEMEDIADVRALCLRLVRLADRPHRP